MVGLTSGEGEYLEGCCCWERSWRIERQRRMSPDSKARRFVLMSLSILRIFYALVLVVIAVASQMRNKAIVARNKLRSLRL